MEPETPITATSTLSTVRLQLAALRRPCVRHLDVFGSAARHKAVMGALIRNFP
jgi:hypothetical protein